CLDEMPEVLQRSELRMHRVVAAFGRADGVGTAGIFRLRRQAVVATLAVGRAYGVNRRKIEHIEPEPLHIGQTLDDIGERPVPAVLALRAWQELVPGTVRRERTVNADGQHAVMTGKICALADTVHERRHLVSETP